MSNEDKNLLGKGISILDKYKEDIERQYVLPFVADPLAGVEAHVQEVSGALWEKARRVASQRSGITEVVLGDETVCLGKPSQAAVEVAYQNLVGQFADMLRAQPDPAGEILDPEYVRMILDQEGYQRAGSKLRGKGAFGDGLIDLGKEDLRKEVLIYLPNGIPQNKF